VAFEYGTLANLKARLGITDTTDDAILSAVLEGVSRWVDAHCGRHFYKVAAQVRYYTPEVGDLLFTDDLTAVTTLKTDEDGDRIYERTWATTDFDLLPFNAPSQSQPQPYTRIATTPKGLYSFPAGQAKSVELTADFGYVTGASTAAPPMILEAALLQSERLFKRKDAIFGVVGSAELGQLMVIPRLDPDVRLMLQSFIRMIPVAV
jgi:hypothetical protein